MPSHRTHMHHHKRPARVGTNTRPCSKNTGLLSKENFDALVKHVADLVGIPQKVLKLQSQVNAEREEAAAQAAEQQQMAQMQQVAQAGGDIAPLAKALPEEAKALVE